MTLCSRPYTRGEQIADRILHWVAIAAAAVASIALVAITAAQGQGLTLLSVAIYALGLLLLLATSALCNHRLDDSESPRARWLRRLDHAAIFFMIGGTYTPFGVNVLEPPTGWLLLAFVWGLALTGIAAKLLLPRPPGHRFSIALCLLLGWSIIAVIEPLIAGTSPLVLGLLLAGGILYTLGVVLYLCHWLPYHHVGWHGAVVAAAACHYAAILLGVALDPDPAALAALALG